MNECFSSSCSSVTSLVSEDEVSPGLIKDGTKCGDNMVCVYIHVRVSTLLIVHITHTDVSLMLYKAWGLPVLIHCTGCYMYVEACM